MAATTLTLQTISRTGLAPTYGSANADGSYVQNNGSVVVEVKNTNASSMTVTVAPTAKLAGYSLTSSAVTVAATSGDVIIGPFPPAVFNDAQGRIFISYSAVTSVTVAAIRL